MTNNIQFKDRIYFILQALRYYEDRNPINYGFKVSHLRGVFKDRMFILDTDIKYLFEKKYVANWFHPQDKFVYIPTMDYLLKITAEGIDYLEEHTSKKDSPPQITQYIQSHIANVSGSGDVYAAINISDAFKQIYTLIEEKTKDSPELKKELIGQVADIESEVKKS
ncbi:MAG: hypothetical protein V2A72_03675, partial [Candidatus Omnitrophota bacterium]